MIMFSFPKDKYYLIYKCVQSKDLILLLLDLTEWILFCNKKQVNLIATLMIKLISCPFNSQYIMTHKPS